jgi:hypothetical protein
VTCVNLLRQMVASPSPRSPGDATATATGIASVVAGGPTHLPPPGRKRDRPSTLGLPAPATDPNDQDLLVLTPTAGRHLSDTSLSSSSDVDWGPFVNPCALTQPPAVPDSRLDTSQTLPALATSSLSTGPLSTPGASPPEGPSPRCAPNDDDWDDLDMEDVTDGLPYSTPPLPGSGQTDDLDCFSGEAGLGHSLEDSLALLPTGHAKVVHYDWHGLMARIPPKAVVEGFWRAVADDLRAYGISHGVATYTDDGRDSVRWDARQQGFFRVNCRDSLDRTNLCIFFLILQVLPQQCHKIGLSLRAEYNTGALSPTLHTALLPKQKRRDDESSATGGGGGDTTPANSPLGPASSDTLGFPGPDLALGGSGSGSGGCSGDDWSFLPLGTTNVFAAVQCYPRSLMEATAMAYVTSGDVCATLYASSPAMHSSLLRAFAGTNAQPAKSNLSIGVERFYCNVLSDRDKQRAVALSLGRVPHDPAARPDRIGADEASRSLLLLSESPLPREYLQAVYGGYGGTAHLAVMSDPNGIPVGPNAEVDRRKAVALVTFETHAGAERAHRESKQTALHAEWVTSPKYAVVQAALTKAALGRAQKALRRQQAKTVIQATGKLLNEQLVKAKHALSNPKTTAAQGVAVVSSGLSKAFGNTPMSKLFTKKS